MDELIEDFIVESREGLEALDSDILSLEQNPEDEEIIGNIFRIMHTIKGTCGFLGLSRLESIAHFGEDIFDKIRDKELSINSQMISLVFKAVDQIKAIIEHIEENGSEPEGNDQTLLNELSSCAAGKFSQGSGEETTSNEPNKEESSAEINPNEINTEGEEVSKDSDDLQAIFDATESLVDVGQYKNTKAESSQSSKKAEAVAQDSDDLQAIFDATESLVDVGQYKNQNNEKEERTDSNTESSNLKKTQKPARPQNEKIKLPDKNTQKETSKKTSSTQSIRVNLHVLEELMQKASELVLTRNQLMQILRNSKDSEFAGALQRLSCVTTELQENVMKTRMQPIGSAWTKIPRIVRDLSESLNKKIELTMVGEDTELDRQLLEMITDPLTHMIRNSADHGLETTEGRIEAGKPETGNIELKAYHGGGYIIIEIKDDGRGINPEIIKEKAIEKELVSESEAESMSDQQIFQFIFHPGFSTAQKVTAVSGRGVGMDVVKSNIEKISGTVDVQSTLGSGTVFTVKIPLTLAIMPILQVGIKNQRFAIPQINVIEVVKANSSSGFITEKINDKSVLRLRETILPLVPLSEVLGLGECSLNNEEDISFVIVCELGNYKFGVVVEEIFDTEEIVVKPVSPMLKNIDIYSGSTILGDGSVILILDPSGLARSIGDTMGGSSSDNEISNEKLKSQSDKDASFILFRAGDATPKVVPLELISRLEEVNVENIEYSRGEPVIQYRGDLMKIMSIDDSFEVPESGLQEILVLSDGNNIMGLVAKEILDIARTSMKELTGGKDGFLGSMVINDKTCDVIDVSYYFAKAFPNCNKEKPIKTTNSSKTVLLVDDSPFFRKFIPPEIEKAGYNVHVLESAEDAIEYMNAGNKFIAVVSDIQMPGMNGYEFAKLFKESKKFSDIPIIALSSKIDEKDKASEKDKTGDFDAYIAKTNYVDLIGIIDKSINKEKVV